MKTQNLLSYCAALFFSIIACSTAFSQDVEQRAGIILDTLRGMPIIPGAGKNDYGPVAARLKENPADPESLSFVADSTIQGIDVAFNGMYKMRAFLMAEDNFSGNQKTKVKSDAEGVEEWNVDYTENHRVLLWSTAYLMAETFTGGRWNWSGESLTSSEMQAAAKDMLIAYGQSVFDRGYTEFLSPSYDLFKVAAWMNLYDFAEDMEVRAIADAMLTYHFTLLALASLDEVLLPPFSRGVNAVPDNNIGVNSQWIHWIFWGQGGVAASSRINPSNAEFILALTDWRPPEVTDWIAAGLMETPYAFFTSHPFFFAGDPRHMVRTSYRTDSYAISSGVYQLDMNGLAVYGNRQMVHDDAFSIAWSSPSPVSFLSVMHPYWNGAAGMHDWRSRHSPFMQVVQHENTAIVAFDIPPVDPWAGFPVEWTGAGTRAEAPLAVAEIRYPLAQASFADTWGGDWVSLTYGETYIAIKILQPGWRRDRRTLLQQGYNTLISQGTQGERWQTGFVFVCGSTDDHATVEAFMADVMARPVSVDWEANSIAYTTPTGHDLVMAYNNSTTLPGFPVPSFTVDGVAVDYTAWPLMDSPWTSLRDGLLEIVNTVDENRYVVDWSGDIPVLETRELEQPATWAGYLVGGDGWVDTGAFMGWIYPLEPYVYVRNLGKYIYLPESFVLEGGAWAFVP